MRLGGFTTQSDPIGIAGGLNLYGYAGGDPINFSDPFGLTPCLGGAVGGVALGIGLGVVTGFGYSLRQGIVDAGLGCIGAGLASKLGKIRQARALAGSSAGALGQGGTRALQAADIGLEGLTQLDGTVSLADDVATVTINMIEGEITNPFSAITNLTNMARGMGASVLRIEASIADEQLQSVLARRYGMIEEAGRDVLEILIR